jgi:hypothetical protein
MQNIDTRSADYSLEFRIPANKQNKSAMKHLESTNVLDSDDSILARTACTVLADGMPIFRGDFKLLGTTNDRGHEEFNCIILGSAMNWVEGMSAKTLRDYDWGTMSYTKANIENYWYSGSSSSPTSRTAVTSYNGDGITFPLICYGAWSGGNRVWEKDMRPAVFMRSLFEKAFTAEGYTLQTDTDPDDFFHSTNNPIMDKIVFPFTGDGMKSRDADIESHKSEATQDAQTKGWQIEELASYEMYYKTSQATNNTVIEGLRKAGETYDTDHCVRYWFAGSVPNLNQILNDRCVAMVWGAAGPDSRDDEGNSLINSPDGEVFEIISYGKGIIDGFIKGYIDLRGNRGGQNKTSTYDDLALQLVDNAFRLSIVQTPIGDDHMAKINFDTTNNATVFNTTTDEFVATEPLVMKFDFNCEVAAYDFIGINQGVFDFHIMHEKASDGTVTVIGTETTRTPQESNIDKTKRITRYVDLIGGIGQKQITQLLAVQRIGFDSRDVELEVGDKVYVKVSFTPEQLDLVYENIQKSGLYSYLQVLYIDDAKLQSTALEDFANGATNVVIADILDENWSTIEYIKGCIHAFNLMIKTNALDKSIVIKTRDDFYKNKSESIDWTSKVDLKKQYVIDYLDFYKRDVKFSFQRDNADGYLAELNTMSDYEYGAYEDQLYERFTEGNQSFQNPLFAYTHHRESDDILLNGPAAAQQLGLDPSLFAGRLVRTARMWNQHVANSTPPQQYFKFRPRMLIYEYVDQLVFWRWGKDSGSNRYVPTALPFDLDGEVPNFSYDLHLGYNDSDDGGLFSTYYDRTLNTIERGTRLTIPMRLKYRDISNLDLTSPIYISHPEKIRGYWIVDQIENFLPTAILSTTVQLVKIEDFDVRSIDPNQSAQKMLDQQEWWKHMKESLGGGRGGGTSPHDRWTHKAIADGAEMWGGGKGAGDRGQFLGDQDTPYKWYGGRGHSGGTSGHAMSAFDQYTPINADFTQEANEEAKRGFFVNQTNTAGAGEYESSWENQIIPYYNSGFGASNAVLSSYGNYSQSAAGNIISGSHNKAYGTNQLVAGQYANASANLVFAIGAGNSETGSSNALSIDRSGIMRQGQGYLVSEDNGNIEDVYEIVNGELTKIII